MFSILSLSPPLFSFLFLFFFSCSDLIARNKTAHGIKQRVKKLEVWRDSDRQHWKTANSLLETPRIPSGWISNCHPLPLQFRLIRVLLTDTHTHTPTHSHASTQPPQRFSFNWGKRGGETSGYFETRLPKLVMITLDQIALLDAISSKAGGDNLGFTCITEGVGGRKRIAQRVFPETFHSEFQKSISFCFRPVWVPGLGKGGEERRKKLSTGFFCHHSNYFTMRNDDVVFLGPNFLLWYNWIFETRTTTSPALKPPDFLVTVPLHT